MSLEDEIHDIAVRARAASERLAELSTREKDDEFLATLLEIDAIAWPIVDPQLRHGFADWGDVSWIARG